HGRIEEKSDRDEVSPSFCGGAFRYPDAGGLGAAAGVAEVMGKHLRHRLPVPQNKEKKEGRQHRENCEHKHRGPVCISNRQTKKHGEAKKDRGPNQQSSGCPEAGPWLQSRVCKDPLFVELKRPEMIVYKEEKKGDYC